MGLAEGGGSSDDTYSDVHGSRSVNGARNSAIKNYVEANKNITILLSFHTFSKWYLPLGPHL